jgi:hypothetical protein
MATNFPTSVDVLTNPVSNDSLNSPSHSAQHANANDAIEAIESYLLNGGQGLTHITTTTYAAAADVTIDNCFTSTYRNYLVILNLTGAGTSAAYFRYRASGATLTDNIFSISMGNSIGATTPSGGSRSDSFAQVFPVYATNPTNAAVNFFNPAISGRTSYSGISTYGISATDQGQSFVGGGNRVNTLVDGFVYTTAGATTLTGNVSVYGLRNS